MKFFLFNILIVFITLRHLQPLKYIIFNIHPLLLPPSHPQDVENSSQMLEPAPVIVSQVQSFLRKVRGLVECVSYSHGAE